jgi:hypothetical protein
MTASDLRLCHLAASSNSRRVRIFLAEKGVTVLLVPDDLGRGEHDSETYGHQGLSRLLSRPRRRDRAEAGRLTAPRADAAEDDDSRRRSSRALRLRRQRSRHASSPGFAEAKPNAGKPPVPACAGTCNENAPPPLLSRLPVWARSDRTNSGDLPSLMDIPGAKSFPAITRLTHFGHGHRRKFRYARARCADCASRTVLPRLRGM